jgi:hypothetical protein
MADEKLTTVKIRSVFAQVRKPGAAEGVLGFTTYDRNQEVEVTQDEADRLDALGAIYGSDLYDKAPEGGFTNESRHRPQAVDNDEMVALGLNDEPLDEGDEIDQLKGQALEDALKDEGISSSGKSADEKRAALREARG